MSLFLSLSQEMFVWPVKPRRTESQNNWSGEWCFLTKMHLSDELRLPTAGAGLLMECQGGLIVTCPQLRSEYRNRGDVNVVAHQPLKSERVRSHTTLETDEQINCFIPEPTKPTEAASIKSNYTPGPNRPSGANCPIIVWWSVWKELPLILSPVLIINVKHIG